MQLMKAAFRDQYCYPDEISIKSLEIPLIYPDEILIRVRSTTVNRTDCANLTAKPFIMRFVLGLFRPKKPILGTDFAGEIVSIGSALIQFLSQYDIKISATCTSKNVELIKSLGAEVVYDYTKEDFTKSDCKYDYIFDTVGKSTYGSFKSILKNNGVYISLEVGPYSQNLFLSMMASIIKKKVIFPVPYSKHLTIPFIIKSLQDGSFKPLIDRDYPLEQISKAYEFMMSGQKSGNVTISI